MATHLVVHALQVQQAVEDLGHVILTLQANGDKEGGRSLLAKYGVLTPELGGALDRLKAVEVYFDIKQNCRF